MADNDDILLVEQRGTALVLTINDPRRRNPLAGGVFRLLSEKIAYAESNPAIRFVVLTGKDGNFCSGGDLSAMNVSASEKRVMFRQIKALTGTITGASLPIVAAVEGWAAGAGFSLAMLADTVIAANSARFVASFPKVGLIADLALLETLPARVGVGRAKQILLYAEPVSAQTGFEIGLVDRLCEPGSALDTAIGMSDLIAGISPTAIRAQKAYYSGIVDKAVDYEALLQPDLMHSEDAIEGRLAFKEKRAPNFVKK